MMDIDIYVENPENVLDGPGGNAVIPEVTFGERPEIGVEFPEGTIAEGDRLTLAVDTDFRFSSADGSALPVMLAKSQTVTAEDEENSSVIFITTTRTARFRDIVNGRPAQKAILWIGRSRGDEDAEDYTCLCRAACTVRGIVADIDASTVKLDICELTSLVLAAEKASADALTAEQNCLELSSYASRAATTASSAAETASSAAETASASKDDAALSASAASLAKTQCQQLHDDIISMYVYTVGSPYNYGLTQDGNVVSICWTDPPDLTTAEGATVAFWQKTRLIAKRGGFPADETDGTVIAENTTRDQYRETPFVFDMGSASDYYFALFTCTTVGNWNTGPSMPRFTTDLLTWQTIAMMTRSGTLLQYPNMAIGSVVDIQVNSIYPKLRYKLAHVDYSGSFSNISDYMYDHAKTHNSIWIPNYLPCLGADNNNASMMQFDAPETSYGATWDTAFITGKAYYTVSGETYTKLTEGTDYQDGDSVADWQTLHGDTVYTKNHTSRVSYGNNIWKESNMRQWLNASGNDWFQKQNEYDVKSGNTDYKSGWMTGFVSGFLDLVMPVYNKTARNTTATISGGGGGGYDITLDKFWLPSLKEFNGSNVNNIAEGSQFAYFRDVATTNTQRIQYDEGGTARNCWLRSPSTSLVHIKYYINTSGASTTHDAFFAYAFLPAMCIA